MADRRSLIEGIKPAVPTVDLRKEQEFVFGAKEKPVEEPQGSHNVATSPGRSPISTRIRADMAAALKRASLERQLKGTEPRTLQDILEQAIEPWLKNNGYLP